jgi:ankyrin repeat protein
MIRSSLLIAVAAATGACSIFFEVPTLPLHRAAFRGDGAEIRALVKAGADVNERDALGYTALTWAARGGHPSGPHRCRGEAAERPAVITALLDLGANPNLPDTRPRGFGRSSGWTPLLMALHHEQFQSARVLLEHGADPNIRSDQGQTVLEMASREGAPRDLLDLILKRGFDAATPQGAR